MTKRAHINMTTKLAAVLLEMKVADENGNLVPWIDRETAKQMTPDQICSLVHFDHHPIPKALGGSDHPTNLVPRPIMEHREKTAKHDVPVIAKTNRISAQHAEFQQRLLAKAGIAEQPKEKKKAIIPGSKRSPWRKKIDGSVVRR